jgi:hypothetical protein
MQTNGEILAELGIRAALAALIARCVCVGCGDRD